MNRRNKIIIGTICGIGIVVCIFTSALLLVRSMHISGLSSWPQVPSADLFLTSQPKQEDVTGSYVLAGQTITTNGLAVFEGRQCQLDLRPDGSFAVTNYPNWTNWQVAGFISTTGRWSCDTPGMTYDKNQKKQDMWGIRFSDSDRRMDSLFLTGKTPPYGLLMIYGDGDEGAVMTLEKKVQ